jgi:hypothetical protein
MEFDRLGDDFLPFLHSSILPKYLLQSRFSIQPRKRTLDGVLPNGARFTSYLIEDSS